MRICSLIVSQKGFSGILSRPEIKLTVESSIPSFRPVFGVFVSVARQSRRRRIQRDEARHRPSSTARSMTSVIIEGAQSGIGAAVGGATGAIAGQVSAQVS